MHATESLVKLFNEWEIQLLVLLSFTLQFFLFFAGSLRRRSSSGFLRACNWIAYLGADFVAVYALGYLSHHDQDETREVKALAFFWAPFLLIHLGGQDTITAFSMEDNNLWLRHLLNLVVQVILALYVFWKSIGILKSAELLASGVLVFAAGIIKYVERIWCLKCGSFTAGLESRNMTGWDHEDTDDVDPGGYARPVIEALAAMPFFIWVFGSSIDSGLGRPSMQSDGRRDNMDQKVKWMRLTIGLMYDELYTKAPVLRSRRFMICRHISQISVVVAFALFQLSIKQRGYYVKADVAITYSLFMGGFFLEVCSVLNSMVSPWTWKMLKDAKWERLARLSWSILSSDMGWPEKKQWWPCSFGQYNFLSWLTNSDRQPRTTTTTFSQGVMAVVRRVFVDVMGVNKKKLFWMSKMLDTWYIEADQVIIDKYIVSEIILLTEEHEHVTPAREWPNLGLRLLYRLHEELESNFGRAVVLMHGMTELHLRRYPPPPSDMADDVAQTVCRKLSNYMMYLLVANPSMLPLTTSSVGVLERSDEHFLIRHVKSLEEDVRPSKETVEELAHMWTRLLLYAAGKSRPEVHASQLASAGGELITLAWLLMYVHDLGDSRANRVRIIKQPREVEYMQVEYMLGVNEVYAFNIKTIFPAGSSD